MEQLPPNDAAQGDHSTTAPQPSVGRMLREARERLGMSIADVVDQTKLAHRQIEALEADDFQHLPEMPFVRGFVRSYAKILHLDAQPLLAALPQAKEVLVQLTPVSVEVPFPSTHLSQRQNLIWLGAALLLSVVVAVVMWKFAPPAKPDMVQVAIPDSLHIIMPAVPAAPVAEVMVEPPAATAVQSADEALPPPAALPPISHDPLQAEAVKPVPQQGALLQASTLRLTFGEASWTEIRDKDNQVLSSQVNLRGSELRLNGQAPFALVIGHAKSVQLYHRGKQIDLTPYINSSSEVARLALE